MSIIQPFPTPAQPKPEPRKLNDRECAKIIGSVVAGLAQMSDVETVRRAIAYFHTEHELWEQLRSIEGTEVEGH